MTNPLFIRAGNPALRPEYIHSLSISYSRFQTTTYHCVFARLTPGLTNHGIVSATTIDAAGVEGRPARERQWWLYDGQRHRIG